MTKEHRLLRLDASLIGAEGDITLQERVIECYRACEGMPDPAAEIARLIHEASTHPSGETMRLLTAERDRLREANAELLEGLKDIVAAIRSQKCSVSQFMVQDAIVNLATALLAKHSAHGQEKTEDELYRDKKGHGGFQTY